VKLLDYILGKEELTPKPIILNIDNYKKGRQQLVVVPQQPAATLDTQLTVQDEGVLPLDEVLQYGTLMELAQCTY
jgi:hypothetical protein